MLFEEIDIIMLLVLRITLKFYDSSFKLRIMWFGIIRVFQEKNVSFYSNLFGDGKMQMRI